MYSHVFDDRVSAKKANGNWVKNKTWLRKHQQDYDATYQEKTMTEAEYVGTFISPSTRKENG
jgi:hypothetical protein